jgi:hypothetical protein
MCFAKTPSTPKPVQTPPTTFDYNPGATDAAKRQKMAGTPSTAFGSELGGALPSPAASGSDSPSGSY